MTIQDPTLKFKNDKLWCTCSGGKCPNYSNECGEGGKISDKKNSYDTKLKKMKKSLNKDHTFGRKYYTKKNRISREKKRWKTINFNGGESMKF